MSQEGGVSRRDLLGASVYAALGACRAGLGAALRGGRRNGQTALKAPTQVAPTHDISGRPETAGNR
jgi:hypothetical protein